MNVAFGFEAGIIPPPVGVDRAAWGNGIHYETVQTCSRSIRDLAKADSPDAPPILLSTNYNQRFGLYQATAQSFFQTARITLVNFHPSGQQIAPRLNHRTPQLVQPGPSRLILLQARHTL